MDVYNTVASLILFNQGNLIVKTTPLEDRAGISFLGGYVSPSEDLSTLLTNRLREEHNFNAPLEFKGILGVFRYTLSFKGIENHISNIVSIAVAEGSLKGTQGLKVFEKNEEARTPEFYPALKVLEESDILSPMNLIKFHSPPFGIVESAPRNPGETSVVAALIPAGSGYVVVQGNRSSWRGMYSLPGGKVESGSLEDALRKELEEELPGIHIEPERLVGVSINYFSQKYFSVFCYLCSELTNPEVLSGIPSNKEILRRTVFSLEEINQNSMRTPDVPDFIEFSRNPKNKINVYELY